MDTTAPRIVTTFQQDQRVGDVTTLPDSGSMIDALSGLLAARHKLVVTPVTPENTFKQKHTKTWRTISQDGIQKIKFRQKFTMLLVKWLFSSANKSHISIVNHIHYAMGEMVFPFSANGIK